MIVMFVLSKEVINPLPQSYCYWPINQQSPKCQPIWKLTDFSFHFITHYSFGKYFLVQEEFSKNWQIPKEAGLLCEVNIVKVILQARDIFHGKWPTIILHSNCIAIYHFRYLLSFAFEPFFSNYCIPCSDGNTYTTVSFTDFHHEPQ